MNKKWQIYETNEEEVKKVKSKYQLNELLATILVNRNIIKEHNTINHIFNGYSYTIIIKIRYKISHYMIKNHITKNSYYKRKDKNDERHTTQ